MKARFGRSSRLFPELPARCWRTARHGTRSAVLHAIGEVLDGRMEKNEVIPFGQSVGLDLSGAVKWLDANGR